MARRFELGFVGAGHMAEGIARAILGRGVFAARVLIAADPSADRRDVFEQLGIAATADNLEVVSSSSAIMLAIKPQNFAHAAAGLKDAIASDQMVISIMAGVGSNTIADALGGSVRVVRVMPNLPITVGTGIAAICPGRHATGHDLTLTRRIFEAGGESILVKDESLMDAVTAVSGSGPAYFYYFVEAIAAGGVAAGLSEPDALKLGKHACLGAARMMLESHEPPAELRRKVTSPGGTTQAALESLTRAGVSEAIREAVVAAAARSRELGR